MGGVDLNDMLVALYRTNIGVKRFYLRIVFHLLDISVVNAWLLYRRHCKQKGMKFKKLITFRSEIAHALLSESPITRKRSGRPSSRDSTLCVAPIKRRVTLNPIDDIKYDKNEHWPMHMEPKKRCRQCVKAYSRTGCMKCKIPLCLTKVKNCFVDFHTLH